MFELRMGKLPAIQYFYELEREAKLANQRNDETERGVLVKAVRIGLPDLYTKIIADFGKDIPETYPEWKARACAMYDERQKKWAFDQGAGISRDQRPPQKGNTTAPSSYTKAAGGATSSSSGKPTSSGTGRDSSSKWTTHGGQGLPMDIGTMRAKGLCFRCHQHGHLSKDCPDKKTHRDIRSLQVSEPVTESKVEEVKEEVKAAAV